MDAQFLALSQRVLGEDKWYAEVGYPALGFWIACSIPKRQVMFMNEIEDFNKVKKRFDRVRESIIGWD